MSIFVRNALPSTTRKTYCSSPDGTSAVSGTTSASFASRVNNRTRANIPGRSAVSVLRTTARITIDRPAASNSGFRANTLPSKVLPGIASRITASDCPTCTCFR